MESIWAHINIRVHTSNLKTCITPADYVGMPFATSFEAQMRADKSVRYLLLKWDCVVFFRQRTAYVQLPTPAAKHTAMHVRIAGMTMVRAPGGKKSNCTA